jgi:hypothetical protein
VLIDEGQLQASRLRRSYRAGVWALRAMVAILVLYIACGRLRVHGAGWLLLAYLAAMTTRFVLLKTVCQLGLLQVNRLSRAARR